MKRIVSIILGVIISFTAFGQNPDTPRIKPVSFTPMLNAGYQFKQLKVDTSLQVQKLLVKDSAGFQSVTTVPTVPDGDDSRNVANTGWVKRNTMPIRCADQLLGGHVTWRTGLIFNITKATYCINGKLYSYDGGSVTLTTADPTNARIDVIGVDTSGNAFYITGTPASDPAVPQIDPASQYFLTSVIIGAGATTPTGVSNTVVWNENAGTPTEWVGTSSGATVSFSNTTAPYNGTIATDAGAFTSGTRHQITYTGTGITRVDYNAVRMFIRLKSSLVSSANIYFTLMSGGAAVTTPLTLSTLQGFSKSTVGSYQNVTASFSQFVFTSEPSTITGIRITTTGANTSGFYVDYISFNAGAQSGASQYLQDAYVSGDSLYKVKNGLASFLGNVNGAGGGGSFDSYASIAALKAFDASAVTNGTYIELAGYYAANDGGGGLFVWNSSSTATDNGGTIIKSTPVTTGRWLRVYDGNVNTNHFGAIPNGSRIVTANLQAALNMTGGIETPYHPLALIIDDRLIIKSNTTWNIHPQDTMWLAAGTNTVMLRNQNLDTSGITDQNIRVTGGIWNTNWANNPGTTTFSAGYPQLRSDKVTPIRGAAGVLTFVGVRDLVVKGMTVINPRTFSVQVQGFENIEVGDIDFVRTEATVSDGVHLNGPGNTFYVHDLTGRTGDDLLALNAWDWYVSSPAANGLGGDIKKGIVERLLPDTSTWGTNKINVGTNAGVYDVTFNEIKGVSSNSILAWVSGSLEPDQHHPSHTTGMGRIGNITVNGISGRTLSTGAGAAGITYGPIVTLACDADNIVINDAVIDSTYRPYLDQPWLEQQAGTVTNSLVINRFNQNDTLAWSNLFEFNGTVKDFTLSQSKFLGSGGFFGNRNFSTLAFTTGTGTQNIDISNNIFDGISAPLVVYGTPTTKINFSENVVNNFNYAAIGVVGASNNELTLVGNKFKTFLGSLVISTAAATTRVKSASNITDYSGATLFKSAGTVKWDGIDMGVDLTMLTPDSFDIVKSKPPSSNQEGVAQWSGSAWQYITIGGSANQVLYKNGSNVATGSANMTFDGSILNMAGSTTNNTAQFGTFGIQSYSTNNGWLSDNEYFDGSNFKYRANGYGVKLYFSAGDFLVQTAPSGSAGGSVTGTTRFRVYNNGRVEATVFTDYADNAAALAGGLTAGMFYRTGDVIKQVH